MHSRLGMKGGRGWGWGGQKYGCVLTLGMGKQRRQPRPKTWKVPRLSLPATGGAKQYGMRLQGREVLGQAWHASRAKSKRVGP